MLTSNKSLIKFLLLLAGFMQCLTLIAFIDLIRREQKLIKLKEIIVFPFKSKVMDLLNLGSLFHDKKLQRLLPAKLRELAPFKVFYKYEQPISRNIMNYNTYLPHFLCRQL